MLIEQINKFKLGGSGPPGRTCTSTSGWFHDKTKISMTNLPVDCYLQLKYFRRGNVPYSHYLGQILYKI